MLSDVVDQIENRGKKKGRRADALRMLRKDFSVDDVVDITELSRDEVTELAKQVEREKK